jgi:hypothetical protein
MYRIVTVAPGGWAAAQKMLADIEAEHAREAAWRLEQSHLALGRWQLMRQGHPLAVAHAAAAREARAAI